MNPAEYDIMASIEGTHWWFYGLRGLIAQTLRKKRFAIPEGASVLDAGCGTGQNLRLLESLLSPAYLGGFDSSSRAVDYTREKNPKADIYVSDICNPEIHVESLNLILSCDVIYIPGFAKCFDGLAKLVAHLRTGGLFIVNLPAYNWLLCEFDLAYHGIERYTATQVRSQLTRLGLSVELLTYRICFLFPAVVLQRLPSLLGSKPKMEEAKSGMNTPWKVTNSILKSYLDIENKAVQLGIPLPWGSSVFAVGRKT